MPINVTPTTYNSIRTLFESDRSLIEREIILAADEFDLAWTAQDTAILNHVADHLETALEVLKGLMGVQNALSTDTPAREAEVGSTAITPWLPGTTSPVEPLAPAAASPAKRRIK